VIDQGLPDGLGLDLIKEVSKIRPNMGIVMYTVRDDVGLSHSLKALGVTYLTKPASRIGLGEAVRDATDKTERMSITGPTKMLIAEDTASVQDILQRQLDKLGVEATFVNNGKEALGALNTGQYGILITDLHMPEMDGYALVEHIRKKESLDGFSHFPVIVLTADVQMSQRETYMKHGFDECLLKPVSLGQFKRLLIRWGLLNEAEEQSEEDAPEMAANQVNKGDLPPAIDKDAMIAQMGAFDADAIEMLGMFAEMTQGLIDQLPPALEDSDYHALAELGHSLKGGARSACCNVLGDFAAQLQDAGEQGKPCKTIVANVVAEFERVKAEVERLST
jgi:CheY-like chemotaxis protein